MSGIGHNSDGAEQDVLSGTAQRQLRTIVERIERLEQDQADIAGDKKEVYAEAKGNGYDTKILRKVVALRKKDKAKLDEEQSLVDLYMHAVESAPKTARAEARAAAPDEDDIA